jgi:hypothetical protein
MESAMHRSGDETEFDPFADLEVPEELEESIRRHRAHLSQLIRTMKIAGVSSDQIEESLSVDRLLQRGTHTNYQGPGEVMIWM